MADDPGHAGDLEAALLALHDASTEAAQSLDEEHRDESGLQFAELGALHVVADLLDVSPADLSDGESPFVHQVPDPIPDVLVDDLVLAGSHVGTVAVAARTNRNGWMRIIWWYTASIWCGRGSMSAATTAM